MASRNRGPWLATAVLLVLIGTTGSFLAARAVARNESQQASKAFVASSDQIASTLTLSLQHEQDLATSAGAYLVENPATTEAAFTQWTQAVHAFARYPELLDIAVLVVVPA